MNDELEYNDEQWQRHFLMKMHPALQRKIWKMSVFLIDYCTLIDYVQQLEGLKEYELKTKPVQSWKKESHFMWAPHIKCWTITPLTFNVNKKPQGPPAAASKKSDCEKSKGSWFLILCYNCGEKGHIYSNYSHSSKDDVYQVQAVKMLNTSPALKHSKNLKGPQQSGVLKGCHSNHKEWLFQLWLWLQKKAENVKLLLTVIWISILFVKIWWKSEESILIES